MDVNQVLKQLQQIYPEFEKAEPSYLALDGLYQKYRREKYLYYQQDEAAGFYLILSGTVKKIKYQTDGSTLLLGRSKRGDLPGLSEAVHHTAYLNDVLCEDAAEVLYFDRRRIEINRSSIIKHRLNPIDPPP